MKDIRDTVNKIVGLDQPWTTHDILSKFADVSEILLNDFNYDGDGWELIAECVKEARIRAKTIVEALTIKNEDGHEL